MGNVLLSLKITFFCSFEKGAHTDCIMSFLVNQTVLLALSQGDQPGVQAMQAPGEALVR
jgi:hypothetical protein